MKETVIFFQELFVAHTFERYQNIFFQELFVAHTFERYQ